MEPRKPSRPGRPVVPPIFRRLVTPSHQPRRHRQGTACDPDAAAGERDRGAKRPFAAHLTSSSACAVPRQATTSSSSIAKMRRTTRRNGPRRPRRSAPDNLVRPDFIEPQKDQSSGCEHEGHEHPIADDTRGTNDERGCAEDSRTRGRQAPGPGKYSPAFRGHRVATRSAALTCLARPCQIVNLAQRPERHDGMSLQTPGRRRATSTAMERGCTVAIAVAIAAPTVIARSSLIA